MYNIGHSDDRVAKGNLRQSKIGMLVSNEDMTCRWDLRWPALCMPPNGLRLLSIQTLVFIAAKVTNAV